MFTNISWTDYSIVVAILGSLYYLFIGLRYYPTELKELLSGKRKLHFRVPEFNKKNETGWPSLQTEEQDGDNSILNTTDDTFNEVEALIAALKENIEKASKKQFIKQEFNYSLKVILKNYPQIRDSRFRSAIDELLLSECEKHGTITLSEDDIVRLWDDAV